MKPIKQAMKPSMTRKSALTHCHSQGVTAAAGANSLATGNEARALRLAQTFKPRRPAAKGAGGGGGTAAAVRTSTAGP